MTFKIALDLGTKFTSIYLDGYGVVLREPTVVAFTGDPKARKVRAVGFEAAEMTGKTGEKTTVIQPVAEGVVVDVSAAALMLKEFLKRITPDGLIFAPRFKALLCIPCGLDKDERIAAEDVCLNAGISEVLMVESIIPAAIGAGLLVNQPSASLIVDIGAGITQIAVLSLSSIVNGCSVSIGGNVMDSKIKSYVGAKYDLKIASSAAEKLKRHIGTLFDNDIASDEVSGIDYESKTPASISVKSSDILEAVITQYQQICDAVQGIINICPPEIAADIYAQGVLITGGASQIPGLEQLMSARLQLSAVIADEPQYSVIVGAGKLLNDPAMLNEIFSQN